MSQGSVSTALEAEICNALGVKFAVLTTSGSVALYMACFAHNIGPGDEVIVPANTFIATAHAPYLLGARVVLADCLSNLPNIDPDQIEMKITPRTKAIIAVHLNGRGCEMDRINKIAKKHGIVVIEDAAQAMFSRHLNGSYMGTNSSIGTFSLGMVKLISTGQGGAIVTNNKTLADRLRLIKNHGSARTHEYFESGGNFKFNDILASIGIHQVKRSATKVRHCNEIYKMYENALKDLPFLDIVPVKVGLGEVAVWTEVVSNDRQTIVDHLDQSGIQTRMFLRCLSTAPHLNTGDNFPNSKRFGERGFILPCGPSQPLENIEITIKALKKCPIK
jgi:perosamine synthetase